MPLDIQSTSAGCVIPVKVVPNSARSAIVGLLGDALKIKVAAPPEAGKANKAIQKLLAGTFQIADSDIQILAGHAQPRKRILLRGIDADTLRTTLSIQ